MRPVYCLHFLSRKSVQQLLLYAERLTRERDRAQLELVLVEALREILGASGASLLKLTQTPEESLVWPAAVCDANGPQLHDDGLSLPEDMASIEYYPLLEAGLQSGQMQAAGDTTVFPLRKADGDWFGFVEIAAAHALDGAQVVVAERLLAIFLNMIALLDYSEVDTLTGLLNRKTFDEYLMRILSSLSAGDDSRLEARHLPRRRRAPVPGQDHWLGVVDIDHFKRINDNFGHLIGDEVLLLVATMMKAAFRNIDKLFRFGGEEFVVLLKPTEAEHAHIAFERFRHDVAARDFPQVGRVTVSTGYARIRLGDQPSAILDNADDALYWVKENGRNQIASYETLVADGRLTHKDMDSDVEFF